MLDTSIPNTAASGIDGDLPSVFLPYQQAWIADDAQLKVGPKSRRIGLTWAEAADDVLIAGANKSAGGQNVYYIGYNQDMGLEFIEACGMWAKAFNYLASEVEEGLWEEDGEDRNIKTFTIRFPESGHRIVALSSRPANLRGKQGTIVIDEAAFHDKLGELLKAALALLIWGGRVRVISTHDGEENPFNALVNEIKNGTRKGSVHEGMTFRNAVSQGLYRRVCLRLGKEWSQAEEEAWIADVYAFYGEDAAEELDVVPKAGSGSYLPAILIEKAMYDAPIIRLECDEPFQVLAEPVRRAHVADWIKEQLDPLLKGLNGKLMHCYGQDFARSGHLSVISPMMISENLTRWVPFLVEMRNVPTRQQQQILWHIIRRLPRFQAGAMDATGNGETIAEYTKDEFGQAIQCVKFNDAFYGANMTHFKAAFEDGLIKIPRNADVRRDLRCISVIKGVPKINKDGEYEGADGKKRHADAAVALFLAYCASLMEAALIEFESTGRRESLDDHGRESVAITEAGFGTVSGLNDFNGWG
ncbi:hypothetical protein [Methylogaea oryzae]|uniref:Mu-like prophage FluMu protein gp28 n=1 Tax=Methylogaea oryzae TaxID=1295382 RepID=A0A8D4VLH7_9GAMM|nr:hypothetical protein [Methylogaea oryzae]BBL69742.1 hypothetical protein MoryE10_03480 [Methylogaea oryzae]